MSRFDIAIVGGGITALSLAWHLREKSYKNIGIFVGSSTVPSTTAGSAGYVLSGWIDNFSRWEHQYGQAKARDYWKVSQNAALELKDFVLTQKLPWLEGHRYHVALDEPQSRELQEANRGLKQAGFRSTFLEAGEARARFPEGGELLPSINSLQEDHLGAGLVAIDSVLSCLKEKLAAHCIEEKVEAIERRSEEVTLRTQKSEYSAEIVVFCNHLGISDLVANLPEHILVPYVEQWHEFAFDSERIPEEFHGSYFSMHYGRWWMLPVDGNRVRAGGASFLRKGAGIGDRNPEASQKVQSFLEKQLKGFWGAKNEKTLKTLSTKTMVGCRPCDELPIVGPVASDERLLMATGFMGQGLSLGFWSGARLSELIDSGYSQALPRIFWPERLRSIEQREE